MTFHLTGRARIAKNIKSGFVKRPAIPARKILCSLYRGKSTKIFTKDQFQDASYTGTLTPSGNCCKDHFAVISINPLIENTPIFTQRVLTPHRSFPKRQRRLVEAWAELHQRELLDDWNLLQSGKLPYKIAPLQ